MKNHGVFAFLVVFLVFLSGICDAPSSFSLQPGSSVHFTTSAIAPSFPAISTAHASSGQMIVSYIDVGQGDSELIQFPSGKTMLIDAGPPGSGSIIGQYLREKGISVVDIIVESHSDADHIGGMSTILNDFEVSDYIHSGYPHRTKTSNNVFAIIGSKNIRCQTVSLGESIEIDPDVSVSVVNPPPGFTSGDINENSVALMITYRKTSFLFPGDAGKVKVPADILKVAHHGSTTTLPSVADIDSKVGIISVSESGKKKYGHPADSVLQLLAQEGSKVYRTDEDGSITVISDGSIYTLSTATTGKEIIYPDSTPVAGPCDCSGNIYNCGNFPLLNGVTAQECYEYCKATGMGDIHGLDRDKNGLACRS